MAYGCVMYLKAECDGCGECHHRFWHDDEEYDPFEVDETDEVKE